MSKVQSMNLQTAMLQYSSRHRLLKPGNKVLAAVSGGIDSMVMLRLLHGAGIQVAVAHCNFGLRGDESNLDEAFVKAEAEKLGIPCQVERFDTSAYAAQNGLSTQMAARELRYRWFHELAVREGFDAIAVAHNRDDRIETLLINLARGTGIHGLSGIKQQNGKIIRPLLFASRKEIEAYADTCDVRFREDSSNTTDKYVRNYIRHHVIPGLEQYFPGIRQTLDRDMEHLSDVELFYNEAIERYKRNIITTRDDLVYINLQGLTQSPSPPALLYEILKPYGFSNTVTSKILKGQRHPSGRQFFSDTHRIVYDRQSLVLQKLENQQPHKYMIDENTLYLDAPIRLEIDKFEKSTGFIPDTSPDSACLDGSKLQYPLLLRKWEYGDMFCPLGMKNMKKLSDFFTNTKLSLVEKERRWVLVSGGQIAWIAGLRIDDRFKITNETTHVVKITMKR
ncbi:MAG: tRNA lysidine(34) synthetase TilS [Bacteroidales bacterium]|jgi:tRNA(Ile)-lysidine synthase|nr:tRNA lysidine(34) synthetase TilS [Bacteroidales bacterium]